MKWLQDHVKKHNMLFGDLTYKWSNDGNVGACHFGNGDNSLLVFFRVRQKTTLKPKHQARHDQTMSWWNYYHRPPNSPLLSKRVSNFQGQNQGPQTLPWSNTKITVQAAKCLINYSFDCFRVFQKKREREREDITRRWKRNRMAEAKRERGPPRSNSGPQVRTTTA